MNDPQPMYDLTRDQLTSQMSSVDSLDAKLGLFLAVGSGLVSIVAAVVALRPSTHPNLWPLVLCAIPYVLLAGVTLFGLRPRKWGKGPKASDVAKGYNRTSLHVIKENMAVKFHKDFESNKAAYGQKVWAAEWGLRLLIVETLVLVVGLWLVARV
ncbi:MAG: hypothetical protein E6J01_13040 [Chloroflexi bacterium]|nr:MAG: hypothetical protein E6J01_13040 [Chloroflexota bacterium]